MLTKLRNVLMPKRHKQDTKLHRMTVEVAEVLERYGVDGHQFYPTLNNLRAALAEHIEFADADHPLLAEYKQVKYSHTEWYEFWRSRSLTGWEATETKDGRR